MRLVRSRRVTWALFGALLLTIGCGDDAVPPPTPRDAGPRDASVDGATLEDAGDGDAATDPDAGEVDGGGIDGGTRDGGMRDGAVRDGAVRDGGSFDGGSYTFGDDCLDPEGRFDLCLCDVPECDPAATPSCSAGLRCLPDGCGRTTCQPGGHSCVDASDCATGSECFAARALDGSTAELCLHPSGGCTDSRDCAPGFACESGACVERRVSCVDAGCPFGFFCQDADPWARPYCMRVSRRCSSFAGACPAFFSCIDIDGDGLSECRRNGEACDTNEDCTDSVCGYSPAAKALACQAQGPCAGAADCGAGFSCTDLWGDGVRECVPDGGSCASSATCELGEVCAAPASGGAPRCVTAEGP